LREEGGGASENLREGERNDESTNRGGVREKHEGKKKSKD